MKNSGMNMLSGSLWDKIILFALPLAFTGVIQQIFNAADVAVVGQLIGKEAMAAVGGNTPVISLVVNLFMGIALGVNVTVAGCIGMGDRKRMSRAIHSGFVIVVSLGVVLGAIAFALAPRIMELLSVPPEVRDQAELYFKIVMAGLPFTALYNCEAAVFASGGDTRTPLVCLSVAGVINVGLNIFFVSVMRMQAEGVAFATVIANALSALMLFLALRRRRDGSAIRLDRLTVDRAAGARILKIGLPAALQGMVFSLSNICVQSAINSLGPDCMAASAAAFNIEILAFFLLNSFGQAATTFIGQNYGAGNVSRCLAVTRVCVLCDLILTVLLSAFLLYFAKFFLNLFNSDDAVVAIGETRLWWILLPEAINVLLEVFSGSMRGYGRSLTPALTALAGICGLRIIWVYTVFAAHRDFTVLMACYPISWFFTAGAVIYCYLRFCDRVLLNPDGAPKDLRPEAAGDGPEEGPAA